MKRERPTDIVSVICDSQGVGIKIAEVIAAKLTDEVKEQITTMHKEGGQADLIRTMLAPNVSIPGRPTENDQPEDDQPPADPE